MNDLQSHCLCNAFKYLWRCKKKHETPIEDIKKAVWYLDKYLELCKYEEEYKRRIMAEKDMN